jgi:toxin ParE1/3/4
LNTYRLGPKAGDDLTAIFHYTVENWGAEQAERYIDALDKTFQLIASSPGIGRASDQIYPGVRRIENGSHVIFYKKDKHGIFIARILHKRMMPSKDHFLDS